MILDILGLYSDESPHVDGPQWQIQPFKRDQ